MKRNLGELGRTGVLGERVIVVVDTRGDYTCDAFGTQGRWICSSERCVHPQSER